ncbi:MAG: MBL fold metallo-hydrolase [Arhodomonas sp.]|nr:MBL fold metallo-hydrolase [Arhodomonas sp.]
MTPPTDPFEQLTVGFDVDAVAALVVTHVHIDHIGRLPYLLAAGYRGPILCSRPSAELLPLMIEDALKIGFTRDGALIERFLEQVDRQLVPSTYGSWHRVVDTRRLGASAPGAGRPHPRFRLRQGGCPPARQWPPVPRRLLRRPGPAGYHAVAPAPLAAPCGSAGAGIHLRRPPPRQSRRAARRPYGGPSNAPSPNGGTVLIPAFSIGRTQELLYELEDIRHRHRGRWSELEIIVDSPAGRALHPRLPAPARSLEPRGATPVAKGPSSARLRHPLHRRRPRRA